MKQKIISIIDKLFERTGRKRIIYDRIDNKLYMTRYYLFLKERKSFPFNIFIHTFHKSDDPVLHDHPWPYFTLILKGGYWEWIPKTTLKMKNDHGLIPEDQEPVIYGEQKVWRGPGHFRFCKANSYHRIELEPSVDCWTMFMPGPQIREWGFLTHKNWDWRTFKWIPHNEYIDSRQGEI